MTADDVRNLLRRAVQEAGTASAWAEANELSPAYISDTLNKKREPGPAILRALGLTSEMQYRKVKS